MSDVRYKSPSFGTSLDQVWVRACGLSSSRVARRTHKTCSSTLMVGSPARCSLAWPPALPWPQPCGTLPHLRDRPRYLKGCDSWRGSSPATSSTAAAVLASFSSSHTTRFLPSSPVFSPFMLFSFSSLVVVFLPPFFHLSAHHTSRTGGKQQTTRYGLLSHDWWWPERERREGSFYTQHPKIKFLLLLRSVLLEKLWGSCSCPSYLTEAGGCAGLGCGVQDQTLSLQHCPSPEELQWCSRYLPAVKLVWVVSTGRDTSCSWF